MQQLLIRILTLCSFILLITGFVCYRMGIIHFSFLGSHNGGAINTLGTDSDTLIKNIIIPSTKSGAIYQIEWKSIFLDTNIKSSLPDIPDTLYIDSEVVESLNTIKPKPVNKYLHGNIPFNEYQRMLLIASSKSMVVYSAKLDPKTPLFLIPENFFNAFIKYNTNEKETDDENFVKFKKEPEKEPEPKEEIKLIAVLPIHRFWKKKIQQV